MKKLLAAITVAALALVLVPAAWGQAYVKAGGRFGVGDFETTDPQRQFHLKSNGTASFLFENEAAPAGSQRVNFKLDNGGAFGISFLGTGTELRLKIEGSDPMLKLSGPIQATSFDVASSRTYKTGFEPLSPSEVLAKVAELPISRWHFKDDPLARPHIGPMAEDFAAAFQVGTSDRSIALGDASGVALAAIQALHRESQQKDQLIAELVSRIEKLEQRLAD